MAQISNRKFSVKVVILLLGIISLIISSLVYADVIKRSTVEIFTYELEIEGPKFICLFKANTPQATLNAIVLPSEIPGGTYQWGISGGGDKVIIIGSATENSLDILGQKESGSNNDVDIMVQYATGATVAEAHHLLTVQKPTNLTREELEFIRREVRVGDIVMFTVIACKLFNGYLHDQLQGPMVGITLTENVEIDMEKSHPLTFVPFPKTGTAVTQEGGVYSDVYSITFFGSVPTDTHVEVNQTLIAGGWEGANKIIMSYSSISDSYPIQLR